MCVVIFFLPQPRRCLLPPFTSPPPTAVEEDLDLGPPPLLGRQVEVVEVEIIETRAGCWEEDVDDSSLLSGCGGGSRTVIDFADVEVNNSIKLGDDGGVITLSWKSPPQVPAPFRRCAMLGSGVLLSVVVGEPKTLTSSGLAGGEICPFEREEEE